LRQLKKHGYMLELQKSKNPNLTKAQKCRQILAEQEKEYHKPTIRHWRDMENPRKEKMYPQILSEISDIEYKIKTTGKGNLKKLISLYKKLGKTSIQAQSKINDLQGQWLKVAMSKKNDTTKNPVKRVTNPNTLTKAKQELKKLLSTRARELKQLAKQNRFKDMADLDTYYKSRLIN